MKKLSVHHVGGRAGSHPFRLAAAFEKDIVSVLYDADPDCVEHARRANAGLGADVRVLPYCLAETCKTTPFHLNYDPYTSSMYESNPDYAAFCGRVFCDHDYIWKDVASPIESRQVTAVSLDHVFESDKPEVPPPDFLSLDTEGSEHAILRGAQETLKGVVGVYCEVEFHPLYRGARLFGDVQRLLNDAGFLFVGFEGSHSMSPSREPIGLRGEGFMVASNALFLRSIAHLERNGLSAAERRLRLRKLAFVSVLYDQLEYALECLRRAAALPGRDDEDTVYGRFLDELAARAARTAPLYPPTFREKFSAAQSLARFDANAVSAPATVGAPKAGLKTFLKGVPLLGPRMGPAKNFLKQLIRPQAEPAKNYSEVEELLLSHGLVKQAEKIRESRVGQTPYGRPLAPMR